MREAHLALAGEMHDRGVLLMAGALVEPIDGAVLVFTTDDRAVVEDFVARDPYVREGLVTSWRGRVWNVGLGEINAFCHAPAEASGGGNPIPGGEPEKGPPGTPPEPHGTHSCSRALRLWAGRPR